MTCSLCHEPGGELIDAGGDVGLVHRPCFVAWDVAQEALEHFAAGWEVYLGGGRAAPRPVVVKPAPAVRPRLRRVDHRPLPTKDIERARRALAARGYFVEAA